MVIKSMAHLLLTSIVNRFVEADTADELEDSSRLAMPSFQRPPHLLEGVSKPIAKKVTSTQLNGYCMCG